MNKANSINKCPKCSGKGNVKINNTRTSGQESNYYVECADCGLRTSSYNQSEAVNFWNNGRKFLQPEMKGNDLVYSEFLLDKPKSE